MSREQEMEAVMTSADERAFMLVKVERNPTLR
jgi:hypothetical protein